MASSALQAQVIFAAADGDIEKLDELLGKLSADVNGYAKDGITALMAAAATGHVATVEALKLRGAHVDATDKHGKTAAFYAALGGHTGTVEVLQRLGADIHAVTNSGQTLFIAAASKGHKATCERLKAMGADINAADSQGHTALTIAASKGHSGTLVTLRHLGVEINPVTRDGKTPVILAAEGGHTTTVQVLKTFVGSEVNAADNRGWTAVMYAAEKGYTETVEALMYVRADINAAALDGRTAVMIAAAGGHTHMVTALKKRINFAQLEKQRKADLAAEELMREEEEEERRKGKNKKKRHKKKKNELVEAGPAAMQAQDAWQACARGEVGKDGGRSESGKADADRDEVVGAGEEAVDADGDEDEHGVAHQDEHGLDDDVSNDLLRDGRCLLRDGEPGTPAPVGTLRRDRDEQGRVCAGVEGEADEADAGFTVQADGPWCTGKVRPGRGLPNAPTASASSSAAGGDTWVASGKRSGELSVARRVHEHPPCEGGGGRGGGGVVRLRGLPFSANASDIEEFFRHLKINKGGVHMCEGRDGRRNGEVVSCACEIAAC